ncbi:DUF1330 domain-containing protein [Leifsonia sp. fls2-241-R2A-40a]|uniref:DUF1330 domain-containing protein n=1 Tax=Leifsonia sp. fls2-241-R2A-40a TaxID=3040290 RepID=UPI00254B83C0|nr:DUF1330 domain-containing protein [Leifsonia sp. fls2-241-R2A-40a]
MSAYLVVEFTVKDPEVYRDEYSASAGKTAKKAGAEPVAGGPWEILDGEPTLSSGAIMRFPDREAALTWYNSPEYQELIEVRGAAMDARFRLIDGVPEQTA